METIENQIIPRKYPSQERSKFTVSAILEAAAQLLSKDDVQKVSTNKIAKRAGVSIGTLYQYFPGKEAIVSALITWQIKKKAKLLKSRLHEIDGMELEQAVEYLINFMIDDKIANINLERSIIFQSARVADIKNITEVDQRFYEILELFHEKLNDKVRPLTEFTPFIILQTVRSNILMALASDPELLNKKEFRDELVDLVVRYLKK